MDFSMFSSGVLREEDEEIREDEGDVLDSGKMEETRDGEGYEQKELDAEGDSLVAAEETTGGEAASESYHIQESGGAEGERERVVGQKESQAHMDGSRESEERGLDLSISLLSPSLLAQI